MSVRFFLLCFGVLVPGFAFAAGGGEVVEESLLQKNQRIKLLCNQVLTKGANYEPGKDVRGNQVVPADVSTPIEHQFYPIEIPVEIDLIEKFHLDVPVGITLEPEVAGIMVHENGRVEYNGHDVSDDVFKFCRKEVRHHEELHPAGAEGEEISGEHH